MVSMATSVCARPTRPTWRCQLKASISEVNDDLTACVSIIYIRQLKQPYYYYKEAWIPKNETLWYGTVSGLEIKIFPREHNCIFKSHLQVLCIETSTFLGSLLKFEGAAGEFKGALGCRHPLTSSPGYRLVPIKHLQASILTVLLMVHYCNTTSLNFVVNSHV